MNAHKQPVVNAEVFPVIQPRLLIGQPPTERVRVSVCACVTDLANSPPSPAFWVFLPELF